jgi:hypothetical protein
MKTSTFLAERVPPPLTMTYDPLWGQYKRLIDQTGDLCEDFEVSDYKFGMMVRQFVWRSFSLQKTLKTNPSLLKGCAILIKTIIDNFFRYFQLD